MNDPYKVLGVSPTATDDEVKKAYRELAKKYHPDNYAGSDLADLAGEKMKEVNEAYDAIKKMRDGSAPHSQSQTYSSSGQHTYGGALYEARRLISLGHFANAEIILDSVMPSERGAEWNYLKACILMRRGAYFDARRHIDEACRMDPGNSEYRQAREAMGSAGTVRTQTTSDSTGTCDICSTLLCADCLCECLGGDLIRCC